MIEVILAVLTLALLAGLGSFMVLGAPQGANLTVGQSSRGTNSTVQTVGAQAGNVSQLNIDQSRITDIWQGFYGNVSGQIVLENSAGNNFYDWTVSNITGEVYATRSTVPDWSGINCTNQTQWELEETTLNIPSSAIDGINETYYQSSHSSFLVGTRIMQNCPSTRPYNASGTSSQFWNVLLNSNTTNTVYTAVLSEDQNAFDNSTADFEILVPVDRATGFATYYFYMELN